jgi:hypothetical protein
LFHQLFEHLVVSAEVLLDDSLGLVVLIDGGLEIVDLLKGMSFGLKALDVEVDLAYKQLRQSFTVLFLLGINWLGQIQLAREVLNA